MSMMGVAGKSCYPNSDSLSSDRSSSRTCLASTLKHWLSLSSTISPAHHLELFATDTARLAMCPPRVLGYALGYAIREGLWAQMRIDLLHPSQDSTPFQQHLQLSAPHKDLLLTLTTQHHFTSYPPCPNNHLCNSTDTLADRGQGLTILLHGPTGTGKTLTAETLALAANKPLLPMPVSDLCEDIPTAKHRLARRFELATRWQAIMLIEDVEMVLSRRDEWDSQRNALVATLLACIEQYGGILILTTTYISRVAEALPSLVHVAVPYQDLTAEQMAAVYSNLLADIPDEKLAPSREELEDEVRTRLCHGQPGLDGRQMRNIVATARTLAGEQDGGKLGIEHLVRVWESTVMFLRRAEDGNEVVDNDEEINTVLEESM